MSRTRNLTARDFLLFGPNKRPIANLIPTLPRFKSG